MRIVRGCVAALVLIALGLGILWKLSPQRVDRSALFDKALAGIDAGDLSLVYSVRRELLQDPAFAAHSRLLDGLALVASGQFTEALGRLLPIPEDPQLRPRFQLAAGRALHAESRFLEAEQVLLGLIRDDPGHVEARRWLGIVYYDLGAFHQAEAELKQLANLVPEDYRPHRLLGLMHRDFEDQSEAVLHYQAALERSPPEEVRQEIQEELTRSFVALRKYPEALEVIGPSPTTAPLLLLAAQCQWGVGNRELARESLEQSRQLDPDQRELELLDAEMLLSDGQSQQGLAVLEHAAAKYPYDPETRYRFALLLREQGFADRAATEMEQWEIVNRRAKRLTELNYEALSRPHDRELREELAELCEQLGKQELAIMWRKAAAACPPRSATSTSATAP